MLKFPSWKDITYLLLGVCTRILYNKKKIPEFWDLALPKCKGHAGEVATALSLPGLNMIAVLGGIAVENKRKIIDDLFR